MAKKKKAATPQPPAPPAPPQAPLSGAYDVNYNPTAYSQMVQPMLDYMSAGALGTMPYVMQDISAQQALGGIYAGQGAGTLGAYGSMLGPNLQALQGYANELQAIQAGKADFDPMLTQQWNQSAQQLHDTLRQQLGPDYATSSAGANALNQFNQQMNTSLASAQFNRGLQLQQMLQQAQGNMAQQGGYLGQLGGQFMNDVATQNQGLFSGALTGYGQNIQNAAATQQLMAGPALQMGQIGGALTGQGAQTIGMTGPYATDRQINAQLSTYPTSEQFMGQMLAQSGNRWMQAGQNTMGGASTMSQLGSNAAAPSGQ